MKRSWLLLPVCFAALLLQGCRDPRAAEVLAALEGPDYVQRVETRFHAVEVRHLPRALRVLESQRPPGSLRLDRNTADSLAELDGEASRGVVFLLHLAPRDAATRRDLSNDVVYGRISGFANYEETRREYASNFLEKIWLEVDGRKIALGGYHMENTYGMSTGRYFVLSFPDFEDDRPKRVKLVLDDIVPGLARQKFNWTLPVGKYDNVL